jgi:NTP pyrophosphatase (non-canonical NTP hydrolase)
MTPKNPTTLDEYQVLAARTGHRYPVIAQVMQDLTREAQDRLERVHSHNTVHHITEALIEALAPAWGEMIAALGLTGEAGEYAEIIKKQYGHGHTNDPSKKANELGDVLWYLADNATINAIPLSSLATDNIDKLRKRYPLKFDVEASIARVDVNDASPSTF